MLTCMSFSKRLQACHQLPLQRHAEKVVVHIAFCLSVQIRANMDACPAESMAVQLLPFSGVAWQGSLPAESMYSALHRAAETDKSTTWMADTLVEPTACCTSQVHLPAHATSMSHLRRRVILCLMLCSRQAHANSERCLAHVMHSPTTFLCFMHPLAA